MTWNNSKKVWSQFFSAVFIGLKVLNILTLTVILTFLWPLETSPAYFQVNSFWTFLQSWERTGTATISVCLWLRSCPDFQNYRILCGEEPRVYSHYHWNLLHLKSDNARRQGGYLIWCNTVLNNYKWVSGWTFNSLTNWLIDWMTDWMNYWLFGSLLDWMGGCKQEWSIDWRRAINWKGSFQISLNKVDN